MAPEVEFSSHVTCRLLFPGFEGLPTSKTPKFGHHAHARSFAVFYKDQGPLGGRGHSGSCTIGRVVTMATVLIVPPPRASRMVPKSSNDHGGFIPI